MIHAEIRNLAFLKAVLAARISSNFAQKFSQQSPCREYLWTTFRFWHPQICTHNAEYTFQNPYITATSWLMILHFLSDSSPTYTENATKDEVWLSMLQVHCSFAVFSSSTIAFFFSQCMPGQKQLLWNYQKHSRSQKTKVSLRLHVHSAWLSKKCNGFLCGFCVAVI